MKRPPFTLMIVIQAFVIVFLILAITQKALVWYLASAVSVTLLLALAVSVAVQLWKRSE
jgi:hypothetical protein